MNQIHAHEVLYMMMASGKTYTKASLGDEIVRNFGAETRFYACSAQNMTAAELVEFLQAKGKLLPAGDGFGTSEQVMCRH